MFGPATIEGDKCARQGPRGGFFFFFFHESLLDGRGSSLPLLLFFLLFSATSRDERAYLHLETGYEDARAS